MKLFYVTNARLPTEKAHGLATVKLCAAFARQGVAVTIFAPWRINPLRGDLYQYYGVERNFRICYLPSLDLLWLGFGERFFFLVQLFSFSLLAALWLFLRYGLSRGLRDAVVFSHDHIPLFLVSFFHRRIFYDAHHYPEHTILYTRVLRRAVGVAVQTKWKAAALENDFGVPAGRIVYWPNGTDSECFAIPVGQGEARTRLGLPRDTKVVLYSGSLQHWKGVDTLIAAAKYFPADAVVYIVGGGAAEVAALQLKAESQKLKAVFVGQRPWQEIPVWLKAADVLVLPNTGREKVSRFYTSPMKLFEYMAAGRPIVASDIPSIREIVDETMVFFATADDPRSFADVIRQVLTRPEEGVRRAERATRASRTYTWDVRAGNILAKLSAALVP
ncbi:MAG: glycosyltransferase family 4 protein [bacterium]|nr:glycosyltransferase family 4 protein [bacterium]